MASGEKMKCRNIRFYLAAFATYIVIRLIQVEIHAIFSSELDTRQQVIQLAEVFMGTLFWLLGRN